MRPAPYKQAGAAIRRARRALGFSIQKVADAVGFSKQYLSSVEKGECAPTEDRVDVIAFCLRMNASEILAAYDYPPPHIVAAFKRNPKAVTRIVWRLLSMTGPQIDELAKRLETEFPGPDGVRNNRAKAQTEGANHAKS